MGSRRTATVRAKSFANLFMLSKRDLDKTLMDYPETREKFRLKAEDMLQLDKTRGGEQTKGAETEGVAGKEGGGEREEAALNGDAYAGSKVSYLHIGVEEGG